MPAAGSCHADETPPELGDVPDVLDGGLATEVYGAFAFFLAIIIITGSACIRASK
jgi:hypothetical protein